LAERHSAGLGLAFNFAGPPGTGKTICAEAIAHALDKKLLVVRYSEMESLWAGETGKNVTSVFRAASEQDAVLFFDEADAIAGAAFASVTQGYQREANTVVNVLLERTGRVQWRRIFATNLAANFDPAFERRIALTSCLKCRMPRRVNSSGKCSCTRAKRPWPMMSISEYSPSASTTSAAATSKTLFSKRRRWRRRSPAPTTRKSIHQHHFVTGMEDVLASKRVMDQSIFNDPSAMGDGSHAMSSMTGVNGAWSQLSRNQETIEDDVNTLAIRMGETEQRIAAFSSIVERFDDAARTSQLQLRSELVAKLDELAGTVNEHSANIVQVHEGYAQLHEEHKQMREDNAKVAPRFEAVEHEQRDLATRMGAFMTEVKEQYTAIENRLNDRLTAIEQGLAQNRKR
jgi:ATP-dependent Lon protease